MSKKWLVLIIMLLVFVVGLSTFFLRSLFITSVPTIPQKDILIGFSMSTLQEQRWQKDQDEFLKDAAKEGVVVDIQAANNSSSTQISQIENMIVKGVNVLVIAPYDASSLTDVINQAHKAGIKVISYDRLITDADVDLYISFDNEKIGEYEAQSVVDALSDKLGKGNVLKIAYIGGSLTDNNSLLLKQGAYKILQPLIDKGEIKVVFSGFTPDWDPENAYKNLKTYLDAHNGAIDGVVAANDGTAFGSIEALHEHSLDGKIPVSGQDAEVSALQRIIAGTQTATVYKPIPVLAATAVNLAIQLAQNQSVNTIAVINNGKINVPSILLQSAEIVTKNNIDSTVIKDGYYTSQEVYQK